MGQEGAQSVVSVSEYPEVTVGVKCDFSPINRRKAIFLVAIEGSTGQSSRGKLICVALEYPH
jgi:hypothetical protein